jgi:hypothetical protein
MNRRTSALALAFALVPVLASAQQSPSGAPPTPSAEMRSLMKQAREAGERFRTQVLNAISPEHRAAIAGIIGQLAVAASPDPRAAAAQIDRTLSPSEKQQIMASLSSLENQMKALHQQMMSQMQNAGEPHGGPMMWHAAKRAPSAGMVVLHALTADGPRMMLMLMRHLAPPPSP